MASIGPCTLQRGLCGLVLAAALGLTTAAAQGFKLNGPLATETGGGVLELKFSPDGAWVVYRGTQDSPVAGLFSVRLDGSRPPRRLVSADAGPLAGYELSARGEVVFSDSRHLYAVPLDGSRDPIALTRGALNRGVDADGSLASFQLAADGEHVVYLTTSPPTDQHNQLWSVRTDGRSDPVRLSGTGTLFRYALSPGGERVVFVQGYTQLYGVPIDGSAEPLRLDGQQEYIPPYRPLVFTPDGGRLLYVARAGQSLKDELWTVPVAGGAAPLKLNAPLQPQGDVVDFAVSPEGARVLYRADQEFDHREELYSVPIDASRPAVKLNGAIRGTDDVEAYAFGLREESVTYLADQDWSSNALELYSAPSDGRTSAREMQPRILGDSSAAYALAGRGKLAVYRALVGGVVDLYSVPLGRGQSLRLTRASSPALGPWAGFQVSPDGQAVVYLERVGPSSELWFELRTVPVDGSAAPKVLGGPFRVLTSYPPAKLALSPDGKHAVYHADLDVAGVRELYGVPLDGRRPFARIHAPVVSEDVVDDLRSFRCSADGRLAVYAVRVLRGEPGDHHGHTQLFSVRLRPGAVPVVLHPTTFREREEAIDQFELTSDGRHVVFVEELGDSEPDYALRSVPTDGSRAALTLGSLSDSRIPFELTPDGSRVVYTFFEYEGSAGRIRSVPVVGGAVVELSGVPVEDGNILSSRLSPDGARVVYVADALVDEVAELFSAPVDGSATAVRLNPPLVAGGDVVSHSGRPSDPAGFEISPDGSTVVYLADQEQNGRHELYRVPIDGSAAPVKLSGSLTNGGDVKPGFRISPDGVWIVYLSNQVTTTRVELFAGPLDGSSPALRVSGPFAGVGAVQDDFQIDPAGTRVVYRANPAVAEVFELFSGPLDASSAPLRLHGSLAPEGEVRTGFFISPDGSRVVYRADAEVNERLELFSAALREAESAVKVGGDLPPGRDVLEVVRSSLGGEQVVFVADLAADERFELWAAPIAGGRARPLNAPLVAGGDVRPTTYPWVAPLPVFEVSPGGRSVLYLADQDTDEAFELYLSPLDRPLLRFR